MRGPWTLKVQGNTIGRTLPWPWENTPVGRWGPRIFNQMVDNARATDPQGPEYPNFQPTWVEPAPRAGKDLKLVVITGPDCLVMNPRGFITIGLPPQ